MATTTCCPTALSALFDVPSRGQPYRWVTQSLDSRATPQGLGGGVLDHQLDQADRAARVVVDAQVLDVDPDLADVGEQPGQLAGVVGHRDEHRRGRQRAGRRACRGWPGCR